MQRRIQNNRINHLRENEIKENKKINGFVVAMQNSY